MNSIDLSIIIPTKNRYECLIEVLKTLKSYQHPRIEYVVQDNSDDNSVILDIITNLNDDRVKYFYEKENLSVVANSDKAILNSRGRYICFIGDDDMVIDNIMDVVNEMDRNNISSVIQNPVVFYWLGITFKYVNKTQLPGSFLISREYSPEWIRIDVKKELNRIIEIGGTSIGSLPKIYHGIVRRDLLFKVYSSCYTFFPGPSPDMASSTALAHFTDVCYFINTPFTISGKSAMSTSGMGVAHTHSGKLEGLGFLPKDIVQTWDEKIPKFWSCSTIWAQSLSNALKACGNKKTLNYRKLYGYLLVFEPKYRVDTIVTIKKYSTGFFYELGLSIIRTRIFLSRVIFFFKRKVGVYSGYITYKEVFTIDACFKKVNDLLRNEKFK
jgi:glycosyltransferase involved in cell wall biosynthesis